MSKVTKSDPKFTEDIAGVFYQLLRSASIMVPQAGHERIREISQLFAETIEQRAEVKAIEVVEVLQAAVAKGFKGLEAQLADIESRLIKVETYCGAGRPTFPEGMVKSFTDAEEVLKEK